MNEMTNENTEHVMHPILVKWDDISISNFPFPVAGIGNSIGFLLVYNSVEDCQGDHKDGKFLRLTKAQKLEVRK
jgi:hypothetical protein